MPKVVPIPILAPLPDIAMHVMQAPGVRWVTAYRAGFFQVRAFFGGAVGIVAIAVRLRAVQFIAKVKRRAGPGTTTIFPFGLGR